MILEFSQLYGQNNHGKDRANIVAGKAQQLVQKRRSFLTRSESP